MYAFGIAILLSSSLAQTPAAPAAPSDAATAQQAAQAAERAAQAAERAAAAAEKAAQAAEKIATGAPAAPAAAAPVEGPAPAAAEQEKKASWVSTVSLGLISLTGNSRSVTGSLGGSFERIGPEWTWGAKVAAAYGQSRPAGDGESQVVAENALIQLRGSRRFTPRYSGYLLAEAFTDHVKSVELRPAGEAGVGIVWLEEKQDKLLKLLLRTDLGFRYGKEYRFQYFPTTMDIADVTLGAPKVGVGFRYALDENVIFTEDAEVLLNVIGDSRVLVLSLTKVAAKLSKSLALTAAFQVTNDSLPAPGKLPTDTALTVGIELAL